MMGNRISALREGPCEHWLDVSMGYLHSLHIIPQTCDNTATVLGCARPMIPRVGGIKHKKDYLQVWL